MTRLTRQHFRAFADSLASIRPPPNTGEHQQWVMDMRSVARTCRRFNPSFDGYRFQIACGLNPDGDDDPNDPD
jgi:hypothetical protein